MKTSDLKLFMEKALILMKKKHLESNEPILTYFIAEYKRVLDIIESDGEAIQKKEFGLIKSFSRMYMETSSDYRQNFLNAMGEVENIIKKYFL